MELSKINRRFLVACVLYLGALTTVSADEFWNTDFEHSANQQPRVWTIEGEGRFTSVLDDKNKHSGKKSLHLSMTQASTYIYLPVNKLQIKNKILNATAYVKQANQSELNTTLILFDPASQTVIASSESAKNGHHWQSIHLKTSAPDSVDNGTYLLAFHVEGSGELWLDDLTVMLDNQLIGVSEPDFSEPSSIDIKRLSQIAHPVNPGDRHLALFKPLLPMMKDAKVIGLGENSHGSATIFQMKLQLLKFLVSEKNVTIFALEMPLVEADDINRYVHSQSGTLDDVVRHLTYPSWQTKEMLSIIDWLREYNRSAKQKVDFRGFDMQDSASALLKIMMFANNFDNELHAQIVELNSDIQRIESEDGDFSELLSRADSLLSECHRLFKQKTSTSKDELSKQNFERYAKVVRQSLLFKASGYSSAVRDRHMADNITDMTEDLNDRNVLVSADNTHVSRISGSMGGHLSDWLGNQYWTLGMTFQNGTYSAYGEKDFYAVHEPYVGTYEYVLSKSHHDNYLINLNDIEGIQALTKAQGFRMIGSRPQEVTQFAKINIRQHFDAILFLRRSTHTRQLTVSH